MEDFVDLFFPLAFFLLALSLVAVVVAFFVLNEEARLILWIRRVFGSWLAAFSLILIGALVLQGRAVLIEEPEVPAESVIVLGWLVAFGALSLAGAYFLLALWSTVMCIDGDGITRHLAFGQDFIARPTIDRIIEVVYFYRITRDGSLRSGQVFRSSRVRSFFVVVSSRGLLGRYALYHPSSVNEEDEFRAAAAMVVPVSPVRLTPLSL